MAASRSEFLAYRKTRPSIPTELSGNWPNTNPCVSLVCRGTSWETTPADIAKGISNSLFKRTVVARLDGDPNKLWDLERPLEASCKLELLNFDDEQGQMVFWHSSAHILGEACERRFGCSLCIGPPIETGFYYEMALPDGGAIHEADWKPIETLVGSIVKEKQKFERLELSKDDLLEMVC